MTASKANNNHTHNKVFDDDIRNIIKNEIKRQQENIILIASENFTSQEIIKTMGSVLTNKYAEGYPWFQVL